MQSAVADRLVAINEQFYQTFAEDFAETRGRIQLGVRHILDSVYARDAILDLGCGNGALANALHGRGHRGEYLGLDFSLALLKQAQGHFRHPNGLLLQVDLADPRWVNSFRARFRHIFAFALLHHIPGAGRRLRLLQSLPALLERDGVVSVSVWNFLASPRLRKRIVPWDTVGLESHQVDPGDHLLDWRRGGYGVRYVHHFSDEELTELAGQAGFCVLTRFLSDGEGGNLGRYQRWELASG
jgi:SAM-dependent methyltransferase